MSGELAKEFTVEAAHMLANLPSSHKCSRLHGHSFKVSITVEGDVDPKLGWFIDNDDIKNAFKPLLDEYLDHYYLNEIEGLENPTSENLAKWIWDKLKTQLPSFFLLLFFETCTTGCHYEGK